MKKIRNELISSIEFLKVGQRNSKPIKAIKELSIDLCKFLGAFAADGCLDYKWRINLSDENFNEVKKAQEWFRNLFRIDGTVRKAKKGKWWEFEIYNKTAGRYLNVLFDFPIGKKSRIVSEPILIKNSSLKFRKAFAAGVLNFDGSVTINGTITLESYSSSLINSVENILKLDKIKVHKSPDGHVLQISNPSLKCLGYFEKGTEKRRKLEIILGARKELIINSTMKNILSYITKNKIFDAKMVAENVKLKNNSVCAYMKILRKCEIIRPINDTSKILEHFQSSNGVFVYLNESIKNELFLNLQKHLHCNSYNKLSRKLKIPHTTIIRWSLGQNGIPIKKLMKFYKILNWKIDVSNIVSIKIRNCKFYEVDTTSMTSSLGLVSVNA